ncbi:hypothetical protein Glove_37g80 [Diversispora epigaea]|uniref:Uncharacterized protein n=1 Tax=Diversispora epigaea TaxID=1348612 RepID=A0A397JGA6_9GLOM|nr:hypothetical protein Glove_37g80 [Diversispora epigaea]
MNTKEWYFGDVDSDNYDERSDEDFILREEEVPMDTSASSESEVEEENEQEVEESGETSSHNDVNDENTTTENHVQNNNNHRIPKKNGDTKISQRTRSRLRAAVRAENNDINRSNDNNINGGGDEVYSNGINGSLDEDSANDVNGDYEHDIHSPNGDIMNGSNGSTNGINGNGSRISQSRRVPSSPGQDKFSNPRQNHQYLSQDQKLKRLDVPFSIFSGEFNRYHEDLESEFKDLEIKERKLNAKKAEKASQASEAKKLSEEKKVELKRIMDRNKDLRDQVEDLHGVLMDVLADLVQSDDDDASQLNPLTIGPLILELARRLASQKL